MPEITEQLRSHAAWIDERGPRLDPDELRQRSRADIQPLGEAPRDARPRRRAVLAIAAVALLALVAAALVVHARTTGRGDGLSTANQPNGPQWLEAPDLAIPTSPTSWIGTHVVPVWTGSEQLLVGQVVSAPPTFGAADTITRRPPQTIEAIPAYDVSSQQWHFIPAPPVAISPVTFDAFWTGSRLLLIGASVYDANHQVIGASYDPGTGRWATIASPPRVDLSEMTAVWTGHEVLTWVPGVGVSSYDPATDSWDQLTRWSTAPGPPGTRGVDPAASVTAASAVWTGTEMVVVGWLDGFVRGFDPGTRTWRQLPSPNLASGGQAAWTGRYLGTGDPSNQLTWYDSTTRSWQTEAGPDGYGDRSPFAASVWVGGELVAVGGSSPVSGTTATTAGAPRTWAPAADGQALDLATGTWAAIPDLPAGSIPITQATVAGDRVFAWGFDPNADLSGGHAIVRAATIDADAFAPSRATSARPSYNAVIAFTAKVDCTTSGAYVITWSVANKGTIPVRLDAAEFLVPGGAFEPNPVGPGRTAVVHTRLPGTTASKTFIEVTAIPTGSAGSTGHAEVDVLLRGTCRPH